MNIKGLTHKQAKQIKCDVCKTTRARSVDHIIPKFVLKLIDDEKHPELYQKWREIIVSGLNKRNICVFCNLNKGHFLDLDTIATKIILEELIKTI